MAPAWRGILLALLVLGYATVGGVPRMGREFTS
jgi:hypothetical protein